jgi:hypothetical protein
MRLHRVEIRQFRKLKGPVILDGLAEPLTVVAGDNEEGKSTVLHALKAALFEHHTVGGAVREAITPYDGGTPEVLVEFEIGGGRYRLRKAFRRGGVSLEGACGHLGDDAAERRLQDLLRFERRQGRSEPGARFHGLLGLFWLDQGTSFALPSRDEPDPVALARDRIGAAIAGEIGNAADGGVGRELLSRVRIQARRFWTEARRQETGELERATKRVEELEREIEPLRTRFEEAEERCIRLARLRGERRRALESDELGQARRHAQELQERLAGIEQLEGECQRARDRLRAVVAETAQLDQRQKAREERRRGLAELAERRAALIARRVRTGELLAAAETAVASAEAQEARAAAELDAAEAAHTQLQRLSARRKRERECQRLDAALGQVEDAARRAREAAAELAANIATPARLKAVIEAHAVQRTAQAELDASATRLELRPRPGVATRLAGVPVEPDQLRRVTERTELELDGYGSIVVVPGGNDISERRSRLAEAEHRLRRALEAAGAESLAAVESLAEARRQAQECERLAVRELELALEAAGEKDAEALARQLAALRRGLAQEGEGVCDADVLSDAALRQRLDEARDAIAPARAAVASRRAAREQAVEALTAHRLEEAREEQELAELDRQHASAASALAAETEVEPDKWLAEVLLRKQAEQENVSIASNALEQRLRLADPETARERAAIAARSLRDAEAEAGRRDQAIQTLETELRTLGDTGIGERLAERQAELEAARAALTRIRLEARAWRLLQDELAQAESERRQALVEPVLARVRPWLGRLFPGAEPVLDGESFTLAELRRGAVTEPSQRLSIGTREQVAVLVRLGLAQLLREREGEAPCLILDDALVYADETRFDTMKAILQRASQELQILILTCRPRDYRGLDARVIRLEDSVRGAAANAAGLLTASAGS